MRGDLPAPVLPEGFHFLERMTIEQADLRADVHFDAFSPGSKMTGERYRHFMTTAPLYDPELDITTMGPDGRFASFAMGWIDAPNKLSQFEPVGTRHEWHRRGLGRAALHEGLRRLKARGVETALVETEADDEGNIAFYQDAGFKISNRLLAYEREI
jgi:ribosomal protein S18 acetylase RimI-like enzyme